MSEHLRRSLNALALRFSPSNSSTTMKFDTFLTTVGDWGKFQKIKYSLICLTYTLPAIMVYTYTFSAAVPNFRCQNPLLQSIDHYTEENNHLFDHTYEPTRDQCKSQQKTISVKECQRCFIRVSPSNDTESSNGSLKPCDGYVYDRQYYQKTLVEEVTMLIFFRMTLDSRMPSVEHGLRSNYLSIMGANDLFWWLYGRFYHFRRSC